MSEYQAKIDRDTALMRHQMRRRSRMQIINDKPAVPWKSRHERVTASERGWEPGEGRAVVWLLVVIIIGGAIAGWVTQ